MTNTPVYYLQIFMDLFPFIVIAGFIYFIKKRRADFALLLKDGFDLEGTVKKKYTNTKTKSSLNYYICYEYRGYDGKIYSYRSNVSQTIYNAHSENCPIMIVVSQSKPHISSPKYLVDEAKEALNKKQARP